MAHAAAMDTTAIWLGLNKCVGEEERVEERITGASYDRNKDMAAAKIAALTPASAPRTTLV